MAGDRKRSSAPQMLVALLISAVAGLGAGPPIFRSEPVAPRLLEKIRHTTWHPGCPVSPDDLRQLTLTFHDFQKEDRVGTLLVHKDLAIEVVRLFESFYRQGFQIERMVPVEEYAGNDDASMAANNTSAFNCRDVTGRTGVYSNHSWGRAIDINPLTNPYVKGATVLPPAGREYLDRSRVFPGSIVSDGFVVREFEKAGWTWGGRWKDRQDYQHFEKSGK